MKRNLLYLLFFISSTGICYGQQTDQQQLCISKVKQVQQQCSLLFDNEKYTMSSAKIDTCLVYDEMVISDSILNFIWNRHQGNYYLLIGYSLDDTSSQIVFAIKPINYLTDVRTAKGFFQYRNSKFFILFGMEDFIEKGDSHFPIEYKSPLPHDFIFDGEDIVYFYLYNKITQKVEYIPSS